MHGVWYAAIGALFVLGALAVLVRARPSRDRSAHGRHGTDRPELESPPQLRDQSGRAAADDLLARAEAEAAAIRAAAQSAADADIAAARAAAEAAADAVRIEADATLSRARAEAETVASSVRSRAEDHAARQLAQLDQQRTELTRQHDAVSARQARLDDTETRLDARESRIEERVEQVQRYAADLAAGKQDVEQQARELDRVRAGLEAERVELTRRQAAELERVAGLSAEQARAELIAAVETGARRDAALLVRTIENEARTEGTERARGIVAEAVQRVAGAQTADSVVSVLHLPAEDMKGRIIGREGRNIRSFEAVTGVNVLIDDTPEAVLLSCFDPVRREVGRLTLEALILDGRIHPHRIEEAYEQSVVEVDELCLRAARDAVAEAGIGPVDERLMPTLGRLKYRTSYGQNVLQHLLETAHVAGVMAAELGVEPTLVKRSAFLHDIGKALTHEVEGSHAIIGAELLRRHGEDEAVAHAVEAHHNEVQPRTIEAVLTQASDTCSASRPGARRESLENYVKRLRRIEEIASVRDGVSKVFAMQSGREVRVMVEPAELDDLASSVLAREIAKQIEDELTYPGQIRVTVVRESRTTEIAH